MGGCRGLGWQCFDVGAHRVREQTSHASRKSVWIQIRYVGLVISGSLGAWRVRGDLRVFRAPAHLAALHLDMCSDDFDGTSLYSVHHERLGDAEDGHGEERDHAPQRCAGGSGTAVNNRRATPWRDRQRLTPPPFPAPPRRPDDFCPGG